MDEDEEGDDVATRGRPQPWWSPAATTTASPEPWAT